MRKLGGAASHLPPPPPPPPETARRPPSELGNSVWPIRAEALSFGRMTDDDIVALAGWVAEAGLAGASETTLLQGFCERAAAAGLPLARGVAFIDTLHPLYEGRTFRWDRDKPDVTFTDYGRSTEGEGAERWRTSPWFRMLNDGVSVLRRRIGPEIGVRISDPARAVRGVADRIPRRSQSLRRRRRHRRDGLVLFGLDDGPAGRLFRRGGRRHHAARSAPRPGDQGGDARPDGRNPGRDLPRPRRGASGHARADRARRRRPHQDGALVQRPA